MNKRTDSTPRNLEALSLVDKAPADTAPVEKPPEKQASEAPSPLDKRGSPESQWALGEKYEFGEGVPQDYAKAAMWYKRAANQGHALAKEKLRLPWFSGELTPVTKAPAMTTVNGFGFKLYGNSDYHAESESYMTTHYLVALFIPLLPIARYRVISDDGHSYRFLGKGKLRGIDLLHVGLFTGALLGLLIYSKLHR